MGKNYDIEALKRILEEQGITDDYATKSVGSALDSQGINDDMEGASTYLPEDDALAVAHEGAQLPEGELTDITTTFADDMNNYRAKKAPRAELTAGEPTITGRKEMPELSMGDVEITGRKSAPSMELSAGEPTITGRKSKPEFELTAGEPQITSRTPFPSVAKLKEGDGDLSPEQMDAVYRFSSDIAGPQAPMGRMSQPSSDDVMRTDMEEAKRKAAYGEANALLQQGGADIGNAISGRKSQENGLYDVLSKSARRPVDDLGKEQEGQRNRNEKQLDRSDRKSSAEAARDAQVKEWVLKEMSLKNDKAERDADNARADRSLSETERHNRAAEATSAADAKSRASKFKNTGGYAKGTTVPGLSITEGAAPTADDAKKVKASQASAGRMSRYVAELKELHKTHGTELTGASSSRMSQLSTAIQLEAKTISELGALSGPDLKLMQNLAGADPSSLGANIKGMFGIDNTQSDLDGLSKWTADQESANKAAYGYEGEGAGRAKPQDGNYDLSGGGADDMVSMQAPDGRHRMVPRSRVKAAVAAGGKVL